MTAVRIDAEAVYNCSGGTSSPLTAYILKPLWIKRLGRGALNLQRASLQSCTVDVRYR